MPRKSKKNASRIVTKEEIAVLVARSFYVTEEEVLKSNSIQDIVHQSLDKVELVCALEDHYHISLSLEDGEKLTDWEGAISYLQSKINLAQKK